MPIEKKPGVDAYKKEAIPVNNSSGELEEILDELEIGVNPEEKLDVKRGGKMKAMEDMKNENSNESFL